MQSAKAAGEETQEALSVAGRRVRSLTTAYDLLLHEDSIGTVRMRDYLQSIADTAGQATERQIEITTGADELELHIDGALPCGMIVNELVTDSVLHAFDGLSRGTIAVTLKHADDLLALTVRDDGNRTGGDQESRTNSTRLLLVDALVYQLDAAMTVTHDAGTTVDVRFVPT
jgi:two-component sensor histidine kinase